jgi:hypothetical protein
MKLIDLYKIYTITTCKTTLNILYLQNKQMTPDELKVSWEIKRQELMMTVFFIWKRVVNIFLANLSLLMAIQYKDHQLVITSGEKVSKNDLYLSM